MNIKYMDIKEFRELGIVQEINRRILHPLGMAMEITVDDDGMERISGIWDERDDPQGIIFKNIPTAMEKAAKFEELWEQRAPARESVLGYVVQPLEDI